MIHPTREAIATLNRVLHLPATGREQDWNIELADPDRASEFAAYLENGELNDEEKLALMALILGALEDLAQREEVPAKLTDRVNRLLRSDKTLYKELIGGGASERTIPTASQSLRYWRLWMEVVRNSQSIAQTTGRSGAGRRCVTPWAG